MPPVMRDKFVIVIKNLRRDMFAGIFHCGHLPRLAIRPSSPRVMDHPNEGVREHLGISRPNEFTLDSIRHQAAIPLDVAANDREPGRHGFKQHNAEAFTSQARGAEDMSGVVPARQLALCHAAYEFDVTYSVSSSIILVWRCVSRVKCAHDY